ncbi:hypothetical protein [Marinobacter vinifirmus]|uniref:Heptose kinase n=1 Tax=Marinobacter vinifirmus TaxID=355591 RepID=A0A558BHI3_9GAMM|nr:hypothetical protein [Marinobacter vinifirmus]TVT35969.1 MAG: hypothetical protein FHK81_01780 [Marinobacter vinifirmus]
MTFRFYRLGPWRLLSKEDKHTVLLLGKAIRDGDLEREQVFRDNWRTLSAQVQIAGHRLLLKVPRARHRRVWERLLSLFRGSDALRTFRHLEQMAAMGLRAPAPVIAGELRHYGMVTDSFVCYRFVEGRRPGGKDAPAVLRALKMLHNQGYLRSDAQLANFLIDDEGEVVFIDFRLKRPRFLPRLQKARELDRFLRSCPEAQNYLTKDESQSLWLRLAHKLENFSFARRDLKRQLRARRKGKG